MPGRKWNNGSSYRYGFNGREQDKNISTDALDFGERIYNARLGRWYTVDNVVKHDLSPYQFAGNNPQNMVDPDGEDEIHIFFMYERRLDHTGRVVTITYNPQIVAYKIVPASGPDKYVAEQVFATYKQVGLPPLSALKDAGIEYYRWTGPEYSTYQKILHPFDATKDVAFTFSTPHATTEMENDFGLLGMDLHADTHNETMRKASLKFPALADYLEKHDPIHYRNWKLGIVAWALYNHFEEKLTPYVDLTMALATFFMLAEGEGKMGFSGSMTRSTAKYMNGKFRIGSKTLKTVSKHLVQFGDQAENTIMLERMRKIVAGEMEATQIDINFARHELRESELMKKGMTYEQAHAATLQEQGMYYKGYESQVYTEEAIKAGNAQWLQEVKMK